MLARPLLRPLLLAAIRPRGRPLMTLRSPWELPPSWSAALPPGLETSSAFHALRTAVDEERATHSVLPSASAQFAAFEACAFGDVKCVILGQDPYPTPGHSMGLSFSVRPGVGLPPSLRNIYAELEADLGIPPAAHGCLSSWARQGVFLLNSALSVRAGQANSHGEIGWKVLTDAAIRTLSERREGLVFLLWGAAAQRSAALVDVTKHCVLESRHPSPLSAYRGFFGCRHFSKANAYLVSTGASPIDWALPPEPQPELTPAEPALVAPRPGHEPELGPGPEPGPEPPELTPEPGLVPELVPGPEPGPEPGPVLVSSAGPSATRQAKLSERLMLIFDTETTGVDVETARIVELGAVYWQGERVGV